MDAQFEYFRSTFESLRIIKQTDRVRIEAVFYEPQQIPCILKVYFGRDLSIVYQQLKQIRCRQIPIIYDVIMHEGDTYILEELISGKTLAEQLQINGTLSESEVRRLVIEICIGLHELHSQNPPLIHRDIKPGNVMVRDDGSIKLIDFDTVRIYSEDADHDTTLLGTAEYASPEHYGYGQTGPGSDVYSLGVLMNELLTGAVLSGHQTTYQGRMQKVIDRCIQVDAKRRFRSVEMLHKELDSYSHWWGGIVRNKKKVLAAAGAVCLLVLVTNWSLKNREQWPDIKAIYEADESPFLILENELVNSKLKDLLGTRFSYFEECLGSVDYPEYSEDGYFIAGGIPGLYTMMEAALLITNDGEIECAFIENETRYFYASDNKAYEKPSRYMLEWLSSYPAYAIEFQGDDSYLKVEDASGAYTNKDMGAFITIDKQADGTYEVNGMATWGTNVGEITGKVTQLNDQQFLYTEGEDIEWRSELLITVYQDCLVADTISGSFGGMNVIFDGIYEKQGL